MMLSTECIALKLVEVRSLWKWKKTHSSFLGQEATVHHAGLKLAHLNLPFRVIAVFGGEGRDQQSHVDGQLFQEVGNTAVRQYSSKVLKRG